jgi:hypothetical protein
VPTARFKINGTPAEPRGFDANHSQVLTFELESPPSPDIWLVQYFVNVASDPDSPQASITGLPGAVAPALTLSPSNGVPAIPTGPVTTTFPATGIHTYEVRCVINNGVDPATGQVRPDWTFSRIICKRSTLNIRKELPAERTEYAVRGWADEQNRMVDALTASGGSIPDFPVGVGDWTGAVVSNRVEKINRASVPDSTAGRTVGHVLQVGTALPAALIYAAINLAGGSDYVTGRLPIANLAFDGADTVLTTNAAADNTVYRKIVNANVADDAAILVAKLHPGPADGFVVTRVAGVATWAAPGFGPGSLSPGAVGTWLVTIDNDPGAPVVPLASWQNPAGDWDGAFGATLVRGVTGTAGIMALHGNDLRWDVGATPTIGQVARSTDDPTHTLAILGQAPWVSATGVNRNSPAVLLESPAPAAGGTQGRVALRIAATDVLAATAIGALTLFGSPTWTTNTTTPSSSEPEASLYSRTGGTNGSLWGRENGVWVRYLASTTGLLAGDAVGNPAANTVVGVTGTAGVVAHHGNSIVWDVGSTPSFSQVARTTDDPASNFTITTQAPWASATGANRNSGGFAVNVPAPATGGAPGSQTYSIAGQSMFTLSQAAGAATVCNLGINDQSITYRYGATFLMRVVGPTSIVVLDVVNGLAFDNAVAVPILYQQQHGSDVPTHDFIVRAQAPSVTATAANRNSGALLLESPAPTAGGVQGRVALRLGSTDVLAVNEAAKLTLFDAITWTGGTAVPTAAEVDGSLYSRRGAPNGDFYIRRNGAWQSVFNPAAVTLAGDVIGPSSANEVVGLHGTAGVVDMVGNSINWRRTSASMTLLQPDQNTNSPAANFTVSLSAPWASATGANRNAPTGRFFIPQPTAGGTAGRWQFDVSGGERFAVEETGILVSGRNIRFGATLPDGPQFTQDRAVGDVPAWDMSFESQAPSNTATGANRNASRMLYSTPAPQPGGAQGWHEFRIEGVPSLNVEGARLLLGSNVTAIDFDSTTLDLRTGAIPRVSITETEFRLGTGVTTFRSAETVQFFPDSVASAGGPGKGYFFSGGANSLGRGGEVRFIGGQGVDADNDGPVNLRLHSGFMCGVRKVNGNGLFAIGDVTTTNAPAGGVDGGLMIVDPASVGDIGDPSGAFYLTSAGGRPLFWFGDTTSTKLTLHGGLWPGFNPLVQGVYGTLDLDLMVGGTLHEVCLALYARQH